MKLGVMSSVLRRGSVKDTAVAIHEAGMEAIQLNLEIAGLESLPPELPVDLCRRIARAFEAQGVEISAASGTFNAIDADREYRQECIRRAGLLAARCEALRTRVITLCTGTRNTRWMWAAHPDNHLPEAWDEMRDTMSALAAIGEREGVVMAFEPEVVNVVDTAEKAERLMAEVGSPALGLVMDPANYFHPEMLSEMDAALHYVFRRVGDRIALAHAKDVRPPRSGEAECVRPAAGTEVLNYPLYLRLLRDSGYDGGLIMHSLSEAEVPYSAAFVRKHLDGAASRAS